MDKHYLNWNAFNIELHLIGHLLVAVEHLWTALRNLFTSGFSKQSRIEAHDWAVGGKEERCGEWRRSLFNWSDPLPVVLTGAFVSVSTAAPGTTVSLYPHLKLIYTPAAPAMPLPPTTHIFPLCWNVWGKTSFTIPHTPLPTNVDLTLNESDTFPWYFVVKMHCHLKVRQWWWSNDCFVVYFSEHESYYGCVMELLGYLAEVQGQVSVEIEVCDLRLLGWLVFLWLAQRSCVRPTAIFKLSKQIDSLKD